MRPDTPRLNHQIRTDRPMRLFAILLAGTCISACTDSSPKSIAPATLESASNDLPSMPLGDGVRAAVDAFDQGMTQLLASLGAQRDTTPAEGMAHRADAAQKARELADQETGLSGYDALQAQRYMAEKIQSLDNDNAAFLERSLPASGWFDSAGHGEATARSAFLIVQHSSDLRLMRLALTRMEAGAIPIDP